MASSTLMRHLRALSRAYDVAFDDDLRWFIAHQFRLPPGFDRYETSVLVTLPRGYPVSPPGIGKSGVFLPSSLRFQAQQLRDLHESDPPDPGEWAWFCYEYIKWDPRRDNLITFLEMVRADLTDPPTVSSRRISPTRPARRRSLIQSLKEFLS